MCCDNYTPTEGAAVAAGDLQPTEAGGERRGGGCGDSGGDGCPARS